MLDITEPKQVQDIVVTLEVSAHGAKVLARRTFEKESRGTAMFIAAGRKVPCRVAWQRKPGPDGRMETGLEIYSNANFWGLDLAGSEVEPEPAEALPPTPPSGVKLGTLPASAREQPVTIRALVEALGSNRSASLPIDLWCLLVDNLEAKGVFSRAELIAMLKKIGQG